MEEKMVKISVDIDEEDDRALRLVAAENLDNRSNIIRIAIKNYLALFKIVSVETLPGPEGCTPVPVVEVVEDE